MTVKISQLPSGQTIASVDATAIAHGADLDMHAGNTAVAGENPGAILISGGASSVDTQGGKIVIQGGNNTGTGSGAYVYMYGGTGSTNGGGILIRGGIGGTTIGGNVLMKGGSGNTNGGYTSITGGIGETGTGGPVNISGGAAQTTKLAPGNIVVTAGKNTADNTFGFIIFENLPTKAGPSGALYNSAGVVKVSP